jgi:superfamily II DNA/RNA helicase
VANKFLRNPVLLLERPGDLMNPYVRNFKVNVEREEWKFDTLCDLYNTLNIAQAMVFVNTRRKVDWLTGSIFVYSFDTGQTN